MSDPHPKLGALETLLDTEANALANGHTENTNELGERKARLISEVEAECLAELPARERLEALRARIDRSARLLGAATAMTRDLAEILVREARRHGLGDTYDTRGAVRGIQEKSKNKLDGYF